MTYIHAPPDVTGRVDPRQERIPMALRRKYSKKNLVRPRKSGAAKRRRQLEQKRRLVKLGVEEKVADQMSTKDIRTALQRPLEVVKGLAAKS